MKNFILPVISVVLIVIIVLAIPARDHFRFDADEIMERIQKHDHIISPDQLDILKSEKEIVLVDLRDSESRSNDPIPGSVNLQLENMDVRSINEFFGGPETYILYSGNDPLAGKLWVLIAQMGVENVMVLVEDAKLADEIAAFRFQADSIIAFHIR